jgi:hypothetical protein
MSNKPEDPERGDAEDIDPGEPIRALARFEHDASSDLAMRVRRTIQRRRMVGLLVNFSVSIPLVVLKEFLSILTNRPNQKGLRKDASRGEKTS